MPSGEVMPNGKLGLLAPMGEPGPLPSGEVGPTLPTCAETGLLRKSAVVRVTISKRVIVGWVSLRVANGLIAPNLVTPWDHYFARIAKICPALRPSQRFPP